ncbi:MAG: GNAT family N-acetyltransferase [Chloroflexi bacterium]|nr:GNAT family N-acetyltransferase [Chloroflexota bacterium]
MNGQPFTDSITVGPDLIIRSWRSSDADQLYDQIVSERESLRWNSTIDRMHSVEDLRSSFAMHQKAVKMGETIGGAIEKSGEVVGRIKISDLVPPSHTGSLGYWLFESVRGRGLIAQCAEVLIQHAFMRTNINHIEITMATVNEFSLRVAERLGGQFHEVKRNHLKRRGRQWDLAYYYVTRNEDV